MKTQIKWWIARLANRLYPQMCWTDLVMWVMYGYDFPPRNERRMCVNDAQNCGACYCGKIRRGAP